MTPKIELPLYRKRLLISAVINSISMAQIAYDYNRDPNIIIPYSLEPKPKLIVYRNQDLEYPNDTLNIYETILSVISALSNIYI